MVRWIALLSLAAAGQVAAQRCELCPGNAPPGKPDFEIFAGLRCADLDLISDDYDAGACADLKSTPYALLCGCPGLVGTCAGLCPKGAAVGRPDLIVPTEGLLTCSEYDVLAKRTSDSNQCTQYQRLYAGFCGCPGVARTCTGICKDGEIITKPNEKAFAQTCYEYDINVRFRLATDQSCVASQVLYRDVCGCAVGNPATSIPTAKPTTPRPTAKPTEKPPTAKLTEKPITARPTEKPTTARPTENPTTTPPTEKPTTARPTEKPTTARPTENPTTTPPTEKPSTARPTEKPTIARPTENPTTTPPTEKPSTARPTMKPTTQAPTLRPATPTNLPPSTSPTPSPPFCFSGETTVQIKDRTGGVLMKDLRLGDQVLVESGKYEAVYSFGHRDETSEASFLRLLPSNLEISMDHMVKMAGGRYVPASAAHVGDKLETATAGAYVTITGIETVVRRGVYAPFTMSGKIVVSDIKASNYVSFQHSDRLVIGGWASPLSYQWLAHLSQAPHRIWVLVFGISEEEMYTDSGMSTWIDGPHWLGEVFVMQHPLMMTLILIPAVSCLFVLSAIETVLTWVI